MRGINYEKTAKTILNNEVYNLLMNLHEYKGEQRAYIKANSSVLDRFYASSKIQGIEAVSLISGNFISDVRLEEMFWRLDEPHNKKEILACGYRNAVSIISNNYQRIFLQLDYIERLYLELTKYDDGVQDIYRMKTAKTENLYMSGFKKPFIIDKSVVPSVKVRDMLNSICLEYVRESAIEEFDNLILIPIFILDFIAISPFKKYNFCFADILFLMLLYSNEYMIGRYISLEEIIEDNLDEFVFAINQSLQGWSEGENDYMPFVKKCLQLVEKCYQTFFDLIQISSDKSLSKPSKVEFVIKNADIKGITKKEIKMLCPDISISTIEHTLNKMLKNGSVSKIGGGRSTGYIYNK